MLSSTDKRIFIVHKSEYRQIRELLLRNWRSIPAWQFNKELVPSFNVARAGFDDIALV